MSGYLLDTNALSERLRHRPSPAFLERFQVVRQARLATSSICVMELRFGAARHPAGEGLWARIQTTLLEGLELLPVDRKVAVRAGELLAELEKRGTPVGVEDVLIGATAAVNGLTLVTRNVRHLSRISGLDIEWWGDDLPKA